MITFSAFTICQTKESAELLANEIEKIEPVPFGVGVFEIEDGSNSYEVGSYFYDQPNDIALSLLSSVFGNREFVVSEIPETDWVAHVKRELPPVNAGRFCVLGSHDADVVSDSKINLIIDAAMAFGTGHHATTKGCLCALEKIIVDGIEPKSIIDIGTGTAVLAMAAAKVWDQEIIATDIDKVAIETAKANVEFNQLQGKVKCIQAKGFDNHFIQQRAKYDLIMANILKGPLISLASEMTTLSKKNSTYAILSGILSSQVDILVAEYAQRGWICEDKITIGDWTTITLFLKL